MTNVYGFDGQAGRHTNRLISLIVFHARGPHARAHTHTYIYIYVYIYVKYVCWYINLVGALFNVEAFTLQDMPPHYMLQIVLHSFDPFHRLHRLHTLRTTHHYSL